MDLHTWFKKIGIAMRVAFGIAFVVGVVAIFFAFFLPKMRLWGELVTQKEDFSRTNALLNDEISDLKQNQLMFNTDPTFVVITAHDDNKVLTNEIVFIFPRPNRR